MRIPVSVRARHWTSFASPAVARTPAPASVQHRQTRPGAVASLQIAGLLLVSAAIGSFLGVVVARWPQGRMMVLSRSRCDSCGSALVARDLIPLISWLLSRGRCRYCGVPTGWFYPGVEAAALLIALIAIAADGMPQAWLDCLLGWWLLALAWIDVRRLTLPDALTLPLAAVGLLITIGIEPNLLFDRIVGAAAG